MPLTTLATDDFDRADNASLGANWTEEEAGNSNQLSINSNTCKPCADGTSTPNYDFDVSSRYSAISWPNDHWSQADITSNAAGGGSHIGPGVGCRHASGAVTYYRLVVNEDTVDNFCLDKKIDGAQTSLFTRTVSYVDGGEIRLEVQGTTLRAYYQGSQIGSDVTDASIATGAAAVIYSSTDASPANINNWEGGEFTPDPPGPDLVFRRLLGRR